MERERQKEKQLEKMLKALANKRRIAIIRYLKRTGEAMVSDIAGEIGLSFRATSKHLGILAAADIVDYTKQSLNVFYRLARNPDSRTRTLISLL